MTLVIYAALHVGDAVAHREDSEPYHFDGVVREIDYDHYRVEWIDEPPSVPRAHREVWYTRAELVAKGDSDVKTDA